MSELPENMREFKQPNVRVAVGLLVSIFAAGMVPAVEQKTGIVVWHVIAAAVPGILLMFVTSKIVFDRDAKVAEYFLGFAGSYPSAPRKRIPISHAIIRANRGAKSGRTVYWLILAAVDRMDGETVLGSQGDSERPEAGRLLDYLKSTGLQVTVDESMVKLAPSDVLSQFKELAG